MRRSLSFGIIAIIALGSLVAAEAATGIARNFVGGLIYDRSDSRGADPCEDAPLAMSASEARRWEEESAELTRAEAYASQSNANGRVTFVLDESSARAAGISDETLELLKEILAFQDALLEESRRSGVMDITLLDVDVADYPKVKAFHDRTTSYHDSRRGTRGVSRQDAAGDSSVPQCEPGMSSSG